MIRCIILLSCNREYNYLLLIALIQILQILRSFSVSSTYLCNYRIRAKVQGRFGTIRFVSPVRFNFYSQFLNKVKRNIGMSSLSLSICNFIYYLELYSNIFLFSILDLHLDFRMNYLYLYFYSN